MKLSKVANSIEQSLTRQLFDRAKKYNDVIDFTLGDPDYSTPEDIKNAGCNAIMSGKTKYSSNAGMIELRNAISDNIYKEIDVRYNPETEIIATVGAMEGLFMSLCCLIDQGDEVVIPTPYWINYEHMVKMLGGIPVYVKSYEEDGFVPKIDDIKKAITNKTVAIIINSPNNPTGGIYDEKTLKEILILAKENNFAIIWDECYKKIVYDDAAFCSLPKLEGAKNNTIVIYSCSKEFSMTGWRIGYVAAPECIVSSMVKFQENIVACAPLPSQHAAIKAFESNCEETEIMRQGFLKRRNLLIEGINRIEGLSCKYPKGTFYAFVNIAGSKMDSLNFCIELLEKKHVAAVPGITYGKDCDNFIRLAYTMDEEKIKEGIKRIKEFMEEL